jgi:hypothetical protein
MNMTAMDWARVELASAMLDETTARLLLQKNTEDATARALLALSLECQKRQNKAIRKDIALRKRNEKEATT